MLYECKQIVIAEPGRQPGSRRRLLPYEVFMDGADADCDG